MPVLVLTGIEDTLKYFRRSIIIGYMTPEQIQSELKNRWKEEQIRVSELEQELSKASLGTTEAEVYELASERIEARKERDIFQRIRPLIDKLEPMQLLDLIPGDIPSRYENVLHSITYLGPLRSYPERLYTVSGRNRDSSGLRGEFTPHILYHNPKIKKEVNKWLKLFEIPYFLEVKEFGDAELSGRYVTIALVDKRTKTSVTLSDVGFGINQLLPVIIEGIASNQDAIICVEQPEIHLHPRLQANIADLMIETSTIKQWIVETHSELLMLRLQRRIREGKIKSSDVSVLYVDPNNTDGQGSIIKKLRLGEKGDFLDEWPDGFFDEGFNELMAEDDPEDR